MRSPIIFMALATLLSACQPNDSKIKNTQSTPETAPTSSTPVSGSLKAADVRKDKIGGDFTLTDGNGKPFTLSSLKGKVVILAFGFTNCPDVCPTELLAYRETLQQLGEQTKDVAVVFVSIDPERDTPDLIGRYVKQFHNDFIGLTDTNQGKDIATIKQQYRIVAAKTEIKSDKLYNVDHTSGAYLIDKKGQTALFVPYGTESTDIATDIRRLLAE